MQYVAFDKRWTTADLAAADPIATRLRLVAEWLRVIRTDPRLSLRHLPAEWPARQAQDTFRRIAEQTAGPAGRMAAEVLETTRCGPLRSKGRSKNGVLHSVPEAPGAGVADIALGLSFVRDIFSFHFLLPLAVVRGSGSWGCDQGGSGPVSIC